MAEYEMTPVHEKPVLRYADRLHEIKRAICSLDESLTPSQRVGNKSIGLSPMFGTPLQNKHFDSISLLDHQNVLTPSKASLLEQTTREDNQISISESFMQNPEIAAKVESVTTTNCLIKTFATAYQSLAAQDVLAVVGDYTNQCQDLLTHSKSLVPSVRHSKKLSLQLKNACNDIASERHTWRLIGAIYQNKLNNSLSEDEEMSAPGDVLGHQATINKLYSADEQIRHFQVVLDWLESNAAENLEDLPTKVGYFSGKVSWENTFHALCNHQPKKIVSSVDPDAPTRESLPLHELDTEDQHRLIKHLLALVRAGRVEEAQRLCITAGQPWRAAVIEGWRLYHDPNYRGSQDGVEPVEGNLTRALWKNCAWEFCNSAPASTEERALYGALSGNLKAILPACESFHDHLWAWFKTLVDQRVEGELCDGMLPAGYWKNTVTPETIYETIGKNKMCQGLYHQLQLHLISGDMTSLLATATEHLASAGATVSDKRFLCHLLLVLDLLHPGFAPDILNETISQYVRALRSEGGLGEVVYYASLLQPALQVSLLSEVLADVEEEERGACVEAALALSIPIDEVTMRIYESIVSQHVPSNSDLVSVANISDTDARVVGAVSWLLLTQSQRSDALIQANRLIRRFLGARKHTPACAVFEMIPGDTIETIHKQWGDETPANVGNAVREYLCLRAYLDTHQAYNDWCSHSANRPPSPTFEGGEGGTFSEQVAVEEKKKSHELALQRWEQHLIVQTQLTRDKMLNVLLFIDGGWMIDEVETGDLERKEQLEALRRVCIPATTFLLVNVLTESGQDTGVVELADYLASEQYQLYTLFTKEELRRFLAKVYESSIRCGCDPLGFNEPAEEEKPTEGN